MTCHKNVQNPASYDKIHVTVVLYTYKILSLVNCLPIIVHNGLIGCV